MRHSLVAAAALALLGVSPLAQGADHKGKVPWVTDPAQGFAQARREGKPIMLFFTAEW
ncbi:MAG: thioredoxin family protein [Planctomycetes bacterium]|nr:thioredoxin family protein [Planctomycetota bacterium]